KRNPNVFSFHCRYILSLRCDDRHAVRAVQEYFQCGRIYEFERRAWNQQRRTEIAINRTSELIEYVIPHFDAHPLQSKKSRDYLIWREAVMLRHRVSCRKTKAKWTV